MAKLEKVAKAIKAVEDAQLIIDNLIKLDEAFEASGDKGRVLYGKLESGRKVYLPEVDVQTVMQTYYESEVDKGLASLAALFKLPNPLTGVVNKIATNGGEHSSET